MTGTWCIRGCVFTVEIIDSTRKYGRVLFCLIKDEQSLIFLCLWLYVSGLKRNNSNIDGHIWGNLQNKKQCAEFQNTHL